MPRTLATWVLSNQLDYHYFEKGFRVFFLPETSLPVFHLSPLGSNQDSRCQKSIGELGDDQENKQSFMMVVSTADGVQWDW